MYKALILLYVIKLTFYYNRDFNDGFNYVASISKRDQSGKNTSKNYVNYYELIKLNTVKHC